MLGPALIKLDKSEGGRILRKKLLGKPAVARAYFQYIFAFNFQALCLEAEDFLVLQEVLGAGFFEREGEPCFLHPYRSSARGGRTKR